MSYHRNCCSVQEKSEACTYWNTSVSSCGSVCSSAKSSCANQCNKGSCQSASKKCSKSNRCGEFSCGVCCKINLTVPLECAQKCNDETEKSGCNSGSCCRASSIVYDRKCKHSSKSKKPDHKHLSQKKKLCARHGCLETPDCVELTRTCCCKVCHRAYTKFYCNFKRSAEKAKKVRRKKHDYRMRCKFECGELCH